MDTSYKRLLMYASLVLGMSAVYRFIRCRKVDRQVPIKQIDDWGVRKVIDKVLYEFSDREEGMHPTVQVVFFHGLQYTDSSNAFLDTWRTSDGSELWPKKWLPEEFKNVKILSLSYNSNVKKSSTSKQFDLFILAENSIQDLTDGEDALVTQENCPIILVGKDLGCLVIEAICIQAEKGRNRKEKMAFLQNIKGFVFYCPVLMGIKEVPASLDSDVAQYLRSDNEKISRLTEDFLRMKTTRKWVLKVMMAGNEVTKKREPIKHILESSSRYGADDFYTAEEDLDSICRPGYKTSKSFLYLKDLISECLLCKGQGQQVQGLPEKLVGLEDCAREVEQKLNGTSVLVIVGMRGSGKTTLAKQLFNNISSKFDYTCFIADVKQIPVSNLENHVRSSFYEVGNRISSIKWDELVKKRILIAMDDVDCVEHVKFLPELHLMREGSKILFTTCNRDILGGASMKKYWKKSICHDIDLLDQEKAERLFYDHAFEGDRLPSMGKEMRDCAQDLIKKCEGLPLTLEAVGCYLHGHANEELWKETFKALCMADGITDIYDKVWKRLYVSYDALKGEEIDMFTDVATFFAEEPFEESHITWKPIYNSPHATWNQLKNRSLVKCLERWDSTGKFSYESVWMHQHFRDLGKKESSLLGENSSQTNSEKTSRTRQLCIVDERSDVHGKDFTNLKYLGRIDGTSAMFFKNLHFLRWYARKMISFPMELADMNSLTKSERKVISFPVELAEMNKLTVLELRGFEQVQPWKFPPALCSLKLSSIKGFEGFSNEIETLPSTLEIVEIIECLEFKTLPDWFGNLARLHRLHLGSLSPSAGLTKMCTLPGTFGQLTALRILVINAPQLENLPNSFQNLKSLRILRLKLDKIQRLPEEFCELTSLEDLELDVPHLLRLPVNFGKLPALSTLRITSDRLESLPPSFGDLSSLRNLKLYTSKLELTTLPSNLPALTTFYWSGRTWQAGESP